MFTWSRKKDRLLDYIWICKHRSLIQVVLNLFIFVFRYYHWNFSCTGKNSEQVSHTTDLHILELWALLLTKCAPSNLFSMWQKQRRFNNKLKEVYEPLLQQSWPYINKLILSWWDKDRTPLTKTGYSWRLTSVCIKCSNCTVCQYATIWHTNRVYII